MTLPSLRFSIAVVAAGAALLAAPARLSSGADSGRFQEAAQTLTLPARDARLQAALERELSRAPFAALLRRGQISVSLVDLSDPRAPRYAAVEDDRMRYAASLPKIAIMLGVFDRVVAGALPYTADVRDKVERMIRRSDNPASSELIELIGFEAIAAAVSDPRHLLYDARRNGGLWVGKDYGGPLGYWHRDPLHNISHGATTRQVARFFVMLDRGELISRWASAEMKRILGKPEITHKFVRGLLALPRLLMFRKSGTWKNWHADAALVEHDGHRYVAVALVESDTGEAILTKLIRRLDRIAAPAPRARERMAATEP